jgi:very-short-patch-repair endonuclease
VLKKYLKYARDGDIHIPRSSGLGPDSPFEAAVAQELRMRGHEVQHQIGTGGYFIDLAVVDEEQPGKYILGIECDGATYHSAQSARDRDRLRQLVLENLGWTIHRIWSTDWFRNRPREVEKTIRSIENAKHNNTPDNTSKEILDNPSPAASFEIRRNEESKIEKKALQIPPYKKASLELWQYNSKLHEVPSSKMAEWIKNIVQVESPVHKDEIAQRILSGAGVKRFGKRIKKNFNEGLRAAKSMDDVVQHKDFLWNPEMEEPLVRSRKNVETSLRDLRLIAPEEIQQAILKVAESAYGIKREEIPSEVCNLFGFKRVSSQMESIVEKNTRVLIDSEMLKKQGNFLAINKLDHPEP